MRWHFKKKKSYDEPKHGRTFYCNHPVYDSCTLYLTSFETEDSEKIKCGLAVIQQRQDSRKRTYWGPIDSWLVDEIFEKEGFKDLFMKKAGRKDENGCYPTITIRQLMWALKMKPLTKQRWETTFDRKDI